MPGGKSKSEKNKLGSRRIHAKTGLELAPRSLRKQGKIFLKDCSEEELRQAKVIE
jgi:hypothetical protein